MAEFNSYWPVYMNLEEETLQLTKYINFSDDQMGVYSMHIADLIMRIVVEIEALSKDLYKLNGGTDVFDDDGNRRDLYFDTDCISYLNSKWNICEREIIVSCTSFNFNDQKYKIIKPLRKANKRGTSSANWKKAYQAVKHDRRNNLKKGNIENLILALGALYILNVYYRDETFEYGTTSIQNKFFDNRLGSNIFAATFADASLVPIGMDDSDNCISSNEKEKMLSSLCIIKYTDTSWEELHKGVIEYNKQLIDSLNNDPEFIQKLNDRMKGHSNDDITTIFKSLLNEVKTNYVMKNPPLSFGNKFVTAKKEVVLNKGQNVYTSTLNNS